MRKLRGLPASPGIAIGPAFPFRRAALSCRRCTVEDPAAEWARFQAALDSARRQLTDLCERAEAAHQPEPAAILRVQTLILDDPDLLAGVQQAIEERALNAEAALMDVAEAYAQSIEQLPNGTLRARAADVRDAVARVLRLLLGVAESPLAALPTPAVILAHDLSPSDTAQLDRARVLGLCTAEGGPTSHTAILARSLGLPAVVGAGPAVLDVPAGTSLVLDGDSGELLVEPDEETVAAYRLRQRAAADRLIEAAHHAHEPAVTRDGRRIAVTANVGSAGEARAALAAGAEGIGLLRTEFLYLDRPLPPSEEEQEHAYRAILDIVGSRPVALRTLDVGGDKPVACLSLPPDEANPALGQRAIRLCLAQPALFKAQLRAALRAAAGRGLKVLFPLVATMDELRQARALLEACRAELRAGGWAAAEPLEIGAMIEVPAAALLADHLAAEVDFLSIGTNDLSQYALAADRANTRVAALADGFQPAVLRLVRMTVEAAHARGKWVSLCGELAGDPLAVPLLVGLGLDELSMHPAAIPLVKQVIRTVTMADAQRVARRALELDSAEAVRVLLNP